MANKTILENKNTETAKRLDELVEDFLEGNEKDNGNLRYQLLYYLAGSLIEAVKIKGVVYMPVIVYHTSEFDKISGENNKKDYIAFMESLHFNCIDTDDETLIYKNNIDGIMVYSSYLEV